MPRTRTGPRPGSLHLDRRIDQIAAATDGDADVLLDTNQMAVWFGVSTQWLELRRSKGNKLDGPPFERIGPRFVRYRKSSALAWLKRREVFSVADRVQGRAR
jgi:hypothetical protein